MTYYVACGIVYNAAFRSMKRDNKHAEARGRVGAGREVMMSIYFILFIFQIRFEPRVRCSVQTTRF